MILLVKKPGLVTRMLNLPNGDQVLSRFTEEVLRLKSPPLGWSPRQTAQGTNVAGQPNTKGAHLYLAYTSANRDGAKFEAPNAFGLERKNAGRHLAFGGGIHRRVVSMFAVWKSKFRRGR